MSEIQLQSQIFQFMWNEYPATRRLFFHVSNELPTDAEFILQEVGRTVGYEKKGKRVYPSWLSTLRALVRKRVGIYLSKRQASGIVAGIPDMLLVQEGRVYGFELKIATGVVSEAQAKVHKVWSQDGTPVYIIRSLEEFKVVISTVLSQKYTRKEVA